MFFKKIVLTNTGQGYKMRLGGELWKKKIQRKKKNQERWRKKKDIPIALVSLKAK